jgi:hypothetical protein
MLIASVPLVDELRQASDGVEIPSMGHAEELAFTGMNVEGPGDPYPIGATEGVGDGPRVS